MEVKHKYSSMIIILALGVGAVLFWVNLPTFEEFTIIVLPDTQLAVQDYPDILQSQVDWIVANKEELNIKLVLHVGDVVQRPDNETQWAIAVKELSKIDVPLFVVPGNHDMLPVYPNRSEEQNGSDYSPFNKYFGDENKDMVVELDGEYLIIGLEFCPSDKDLLEADIIISQHKDKKVIVVTHAYMAQRGRSSPIDFLHCGKSPERFAEDWNNGEDIYQELIKKHDNIFMVHSGHFLGQSYQTSCTNGKPTHEILQNYQYLPNGGEGLLRIYGFKKDKITVLSYSPVYDQYLGDEANSFNLTYNC